MAYRRSTLLSMKWQDSIFIQKAGVMRGVQTAVCLNIDAPRKRIRRIGCVLVHLCVFSANRHLIRESAGPKGVLECSSILGSEFWTANIKKTISYRYEYLENVRFIYFVRWNDWNLIFCEFLKYGADYWLWGCSVMSWGICQSIAHKITAVAVRSRSKTFRFALSPSTARFSNLDV